MTTSTSPAPTCPIGCVAEHDRGDLDHAWPPLAIAVLAPQNGDEPYVLIGPGRDETGAWCELDVNGAHVRVRLADLVAGVAGAGEQVAA